MEVWVLGSGVTSRRPPDRGLRRFWEPEAVPGPPGLVVTKAPVAQEFLYSLTAFKVLFYTTSHAAELALSLSAV